MYEALPLLSAALVALSAYFIGSQFVKFVFFHWQKFKPHENTVKRFWLFTDSKTPPVWLFKILGGKKIEKYLNTSGLHPSWTVKRIVNLKIIVLPISLLIYFSIGLLFSDFYTALALPILVYIGPDYALARLSTKRKIYCSRTLAQVIDILRLQASIGLNLESSINNLANSKKGLWAKEFKKVDFEIQNGLPLVLALERMAARFDVEDLTRFAMAIKQSKVLGASLSETLAIQADNLRIRRRQKAEEKAKLASVKITFPLVLFIFPALLIIYLAPAVLSVMELG